MGRAAAWVRWIKLKEGDRVIEVAISGEDQEYLFIVTEKWMWKITAVEEYRNQNRWGSWVKAMAVTDKTGKLVSAKMISEEDRKNSQVILISKGGQTIRLPLKWIRKTSRVTSRVTQWVILTKLKDASDEIVRASMVRESEDEE